MGSGDVVDGSRVAESHEWSSKSCSHAKGARINMECADNGRFVICARGVDGVGTHV